MSKNHDLFSHNLISLTIKVKNNYHNIIKLLGFGDLMVIENIFQNYGYNTIIGYSGKDITDDMIEACMAIDKKFYGGEYTWANSMKNIVQKFNQMCFVFIDTAENAIVGYSFWVPIKTQVFNDFIKNKKMLLDFEDSYFSDYKQSSVNLFLAGEAYVLGYDIKNLHKAVEDIIQKRILDLAYMGVKVKYVAIESCCKFEEEFLVPLLGLTKKVKKDKSTFYYDEYSPNKVYKRSKYSEGIRQFYTKDKTSK